MGKFSPTNYDPRKDSSPNTEAYRPGYKGDPPGLAGVILDRTTLPEPYAHLRPCPCGCRQPLAAGSTYRMGHDMRLKGILIRAHLTATDVNVLGDGGTWTGPAIEEAARWSTANLDWEVMLKEAEAKQGPSVKAKLERANREVLARATGLAEGDRKLIRVGRWDYTGQVVAIYSVNGEAEVEFEYVTKAGEVKTKRLPASEVK